MNKITLCLSFLAVMMVRPSVGDAQRARPIADVTPQRLLDGDAEPGEWLTGGRDWRQSYYSSLDQINKSNVVQLGFAWARDISSGRTGATPIVVDGVMYTSGNKGAVYALDARTGAERWTFTPDVDPDIFRKHCCSGINRGVAVWRGKVYVASVDGYLYALDAGTGAVRWKADTFIDRSKGYSSTGAPYIANNVVVIGHGGAEFDARGYITAYDTESGKKAWRFFTVPGDPQKGFEHPELEMAAKTWDPHSLWEVGLGGTVWDGMAYDPKLNLLYVGTGNALPYPRKLRSPAGGDNLFLACILAINPDTGRLKWYYQTVPGEQWDYTATQKPVLADLTIGGKLRQVIMQAPKNGFFYVLDRATGQLLSAQPFAKVTWADRVDLDTGRPVESNVSDYSQSPKLIFPGGGHGAHNWQPMAYNPSTGLVYIPVFENSNIYRMPAASFEYKKAQTNLGAEWVYPDRIEKDLSGSWPKIESLYAGRDYHARNILKAWDPVRQRVAWQVETTGEKPASHVDSGGVMTTAAGLVFQGRKDGLLYVFDASTGTQLHSIDVSTSMSSAPMTYRVAGEQYVAILAGTANSPGFIDYKYGARTRVVAFKLGGGAVPKYPEVRRRDSGAPPVVFTSTSQQLALGKSLYDRNCAVCHADAGIAPDLDKMSEPTHRQFMDIVLKGVRSDKGMGNFSAVLSSEDARAIHAYLVTRAWENYRRQLNGGPANVLSAAARHCAKPRKTGPPLSLLIVTGGHPYEPSEFFATFADMPDVRYQHYYLVGNKPFSVPLGGLGQYDVVLFYDMQQGEITPEWRSLLSRGGSFIFLHHAIGSFPQSQEFKTFAGGHANFSQVPIAGVSNTTVHFNQRQRFTVADPGHPITCGISDFDMLDEAYDNVDALPGVHVLVKSDLPKASPAVGWTWNYQGKRVVYLQPGHGNLGLPPDHGPSSYQSEPFKKLIERAIQWAAGRL